VLYQGGLSRRLRPVDLSHPSARNAAHSQRQVERNRAGRDRLDAQPTVGLAQLHDRALAETALDLRYGEVDGLLAITVNHRRLTPAFAATRTCAPSLGPLLHRLAGSDVWHLKAPSQYSTFVLCSP
jgi:hypothetical protein